MLKLVVGLVLLMSLPLISVAAEPAAVEATPPIAATPIAPAVAPEAAVAPAAAVAPVAQAAVAVPAAPPATYPPGYLPWKAPQGK